MSCIIILSTCIIPFLMPPNLYLIILSLFLKGFTWETGCERRQRRAGKRRKHMLIKLLKMAKDVAQYKWKIIQSCLVKKIICIIWSVFSLFFVSLLLSLTHKLWQTHSLIHTQTAVGHRRFAWSHWHRWSARFPRSERTEGKNVVHQKISTFALDQLTKNTQLLDWLIFILCRAKKESAFKVFRVHVESRERRYITVNFKRKNYKYRVYHFIERRKQSSVIVQI